jgi:hypothetical protein
MNSSDLAFGKMQKRKISIFVVLVVDFLRPQYRNLVFPGIDYYL